MQFFRKRNDIILKTELSAKYILKNQNVVI